MTEKLLSLRIPAELAKRLAKATNKARDPYAPGQTAILLRGLELALREVEKK